MSDALSKEAIELLIDQGVKNQMDKDAHEKLEINGKTYIKFGGNIVRYDPVDDPAAEKTVVYTLDGLIDWIKADINDFFKDKDRKSIVRVVSPNIVSVETPVQGHQRTIHKLAECDYHAPSITYGTFIDAEMMGVDLQSKFIEDENRDTVLRIVRNMGEEQSLQTADDGISQRVTVKSGVKEVDSSIFRNPAYLRPMRTFPEVEQPVSAFVVRFQEGRRAALYESDGGAWRHIAVRRIGEYLSVRLEGCNVVVIA